MTAAFIVLFFLWQVTHLGGFSWNFDEGVCLVKARMVKLGYPLYKEIWSDQPPLFIELLALAFAIFGEHVAVGRIVVICFGVVGLLSVAMIAYELGGAWAAAAAAVILALSPYFFALSRAVMVGLPSVCLATASVAFALLYLRTGLKRWLLLTGLFFAASLLVKLVSTFIIAILVLVVLLRVWKVRDWRKAFWDLILLGLAIVVPIILCVLAYDKRAMLEQIAGTYFVSKKAYPANPLFNLGEIWHHLGTNNFGMAALALYGLWALWVKRSTPGLVIFVWLIITFFILATHSPLWWHHLALLFFPLAVLAGVGMDYWGKNLASLAKGVAFKHLRLAFGLAALLMYLVGLPQMIRMDIWLIEGPKLRSSQKAVPFVEAITNPEDFVVTDELMIAFRAKRKVPPSLCVPSEKRIEAGELTSEELIKVSQEYNVRAVIFWTDRLNKLSDYVQWVKANYHLVSSSGSREIYLR